MSTADFDSVIRGHHIYKAVWHPIVGEILAVCIERGNVPDRHAVCVQRGSVTVGHVPREVAKVNHVWKRIGDRHSKLGTQKMNTTQPNFIFWVKLYTCYTVYVTVYGSKC